MFFRSPLLGASGAKYLVAIAKAGAEKRKSRYIHSIKWLG